MDRVPSRRTLLVGSFAVVFAVTLLAALSTAGAIVAHMELGTTGSATVEGIDPADDPDRLDVTLSLENPTGTAVEIRSAWLLVDHGDERVASNSGIAFDTVVVPAGERRSLVFEVSIIAEDVESVRRAAEAGDLTASGHLEGSVVDQNVRISIEDDRA